MNSKIAGLFVVALIAGPCCAEPIHLVCSGGGSATRATHSTAYAANSNGEYATANVTGTRSVGFEDQVNIDIDGDTGRIRVPRSMLPPLHGGEAGWFELKNLKTTEQEITGSAAINFINSPKVRLDRLTGHVIISGKAGDFSGQCEPYDPATAKRKF